MGLGYLNGQTHITYFQWSAYDCWCTNNLTRLIVGMEYTIHFSHSPLPPSGRMTSCKHRSFEDLSRILMSLFHF